MNVDPKPRRKAARLKREAMQRLGESAETGAILADLKTRGIVVAAAQVASIRARIEPLENR